MISNTMDYVFSLENKKIIKLSIDEFRDRVLSKRYSKVEIEKINSQHEKRRELGKRNCHCVKPRGLCYGEECLC